MLTTDRSYQDLLTEMESKSFGNKWVAAYELSKVIASSQVPKEEIPELIKRLGYIYKSSSVDPRTRTLSWPPWVLLTTASPCRYFYSPKRSG